MTRSPTAAHERFPATTLRAFFEAVENNDAVDRDASLPDAAGSCTAADMRRCFALCLQSWEDGVERRDLLRLVDALLRRGDLDAAERLRFKHARARYKQLRFALMLYDARPAPPLLFRLTVATMGHLQDALRNRRRGAVVGRALLLRALLTPPSWAAVRRQVRTVRFHAEGGFLAARRGELRRLRDALARESLSGPEFHAVRKIVSRHVSLHDALRTLRPDERARRTSRFLATVNGLMGSRHDEMVRDAATGRRSYRARTPLSPDLRGRLEQFVARGDQCRREEESTRMAGTIAADSVRSGDQRSRSRCSCVRPSRPGARPG